MEIPLKKLVNVENEKISESGFLSVKLFLDEGGTTFDPVAREFLNLQQTVKCRFR